MAHVQYSSVIPVSKDDLFDFLSDYRKRPRIMPPDVQLELTSVPLDLKTGAKYDFKITRFGLSYAFTVTIEECEPKVRIVEKTQTAFFEEWTNTILFEEHGENATRLTSIMDYRLPYGVLGTLADDLFVKGDLMRIITFSHNKLKSFFE
jgi:ribosome-associated toxin RatA of RatAB toxin-antitoxin module